MADNADLDSLLDALSLGAGAAASTPKAAASPQAVQLLDDAVAEEQAGGGIDDELDNLLGSLSLSGSARPAASTNSANAAAEDDVDGGVAPSSAPSSADGFGAVPKIALRDYQRALIASVGRRYERGHLSVLAYLPTGGGKTHVAAAEVAAELGRGGRALVVVNSRTLLEQTRRAFLTLGFGHGLLGLLGSGEKPEWDRPVQVCVGRPVRERASREPLSLVSVLFMRRGSPEVNPALPPPPRLR